MNLQLLFSLDVYHNSFILKEQATRGIYTAGNASYVTGVKKTICYASPTAHPIYIGTVNTYTDYIIIMLRFVGYAGRIKLHG